MSIEILLIKKKKITPEIKYEIYVDYPPKEAINSWVLVAIIFGATLLACISVFLSWCFYQKRKQGTSRSRPFAPEDSVYDPILNGNTLQDIIEMTTSGSGSGMPLIITRSYIHTYVEW